MAGASSAPPPLSASTVVVIDAQREYTDGKLPLANVQPALDQIGALLRRARALQIPVIHIVHQGKPATVIASATATRALPDPLGGPALSAEEVQRNALAAIADRFAIVTPKVDSLPD